MDVDVNVVGLVLLGLATVSGAVLFGMFALAARGKERAIQAGAIAVHGSFAAVGIILWFWFTNSASETGGARPAVIVLLAVVLLAGLLMLRSWNEARKDDPEGETIPEASVKPLHLAGHLLVGSAALIAVVAAAVRG